IVDDEEDVNPAILAIEVTRRDVAELMGVHQSADVLLDGVGVVLDAGARPEFGDDLLCGHTAIAGDLDVSDQDAASRCGLLSETEPAAHDDAEKDGGQTGRSRVEADHRA